MRVQACYMADSLEGKFVGRDVLEDDRGYCGQGVAQGGIVDTPDGQWYAILFQDYGAVGRLPILIPVKWEEDYPVFGDRGRVPRNIETKSTRPGYVYQSMTGSDDFICRSDRNGEYHLSGRWQFNHEPDPNFYKVDGIRGVYIVTASKVCADLLQAENMITQRMRFPACAAEITVDAAHLSEGDYAGICALQRHYGMAAVTRREGKLWLVRERSRGIDGDCTVQEEIFLKGTSVRFRVEAEFAQMKDEVRFFYYDEGGIVQLGKEHKLFFDLEHFTGCRFGLFLYASRQSGGRAFFRKFVYESS